MDDKTRLDLYRVMVLSRTFEEAILREYHADKKPAFDIGAGLVPGEMHLSAGQEPVARRVCAHLRAGRRGHRDPPAASRGHRARCGPGQDGCRDLRARGRARAWPGRAHAPVRPGRPLLLLGHHRRGLPPALGQAFAFSRGEGNRVAVAFTGEGAANQGAFHESLNLAALWKLPVVFVVEDNDWAISVPRDASTCIPSNADRAAAYGIPGQRIDDNDVEAIYTTAGDAVARARAGEGPTLLEIHTAAAVGPLRGRPPGLPARAGRRSGQGPDPGLRAAADARPASWTRTRHGPSRTRHRPGSRRRSRSRSPARFPRRRRRLTTSSREGGRSMSATETTTAAEDAPAGQSGRKLTTARAMAEGIAQEMERDAGVVVLGEDHRELRRHLRLDHRAAGEVRPGPGAGHADLGDRVHRPRHRCGGRGHAPGRRADVRRLPSASPWTRSTTTWRRSTSSPAGTCACRWC